MNQAHRWLSAVFITVWVMGCSHAPAPTLKSQQQTSAPVAAQQGTPLVEVPETEFDFGVVNEENEYMHEFKVFNKGNGVLEIKKVLTA